MALKSSSGYNNAAFTNQYDYDQLARNPAQLTERNITYVPASAMDNYCYEGDEEIPMSTIVTRQQIRHLVREPPIGASTTFRFIESRPENSASRITTSPQKYRYSVIKTEETIASPRTPTKNSSSVTSTPRKQSGNLPRRSQSLASPRRPQINRVAIPLSPGPVVRSIQATVPSKPMVRTPSKPAECNVTYVLTPEVTMSPQRSTAIIPPLYTTTDVSTSSNPSTTYKKKEPFLATGVIRKSPVKVEVSSGYKASWIHTPMPYQTPPTATIATAAIFLLLCGVTTAVLCFYMMYKKCTLYYLDFGVLSGLGSALLGCLGFRSRRWQWLPNRNYVSGYVVLSMFSLLSCASLIIILILQPKPGEPLADVTGGAVCGIAALSLILTAFGVVSSRCCKYPPPDNRVEHCAQGFTL
ncbi:hypothetical protein L9F63_007449 [Diploptera punctata]|uniref:Sanpodo n=1 Tax=Diploptera punctata TaxID=6984 RepID=A0AAD7Z7N9_DIPPU|nr:hypothetical protein L9F63_007449 [Diploptera punctata]